MADTTNTSSSNNNDMKPNTPPSTAAAENSTLASEGVPKPAGDASQTASGLPPITKEPMSIAGAPLVPVNPLTQTKVPTPPPEPATAPAAATQNAELTQASAPESGVKDKLDAADNLAQQPSKPEETAPSAVPASADATSSALEQPNLVATNGASQDAPKPVSVQEVQDEAAPAPAAAEKAPEPVTEKPAEAVAPEPSAQPAPAVAADPDTMDIDKPEAETGDKRKADESEVANGALPADKSQDGGDEPAGKKLKTNGEEPVPAPKKVGRPKKDKTVEKKAAPAPVRRTTRQTRSQGAPAGESL
ncbi:hypothetical protein Micbo1qcDRAFT_233254 [Microdochium bolleyi]|uniref:Uncharacterized protein n=1 Tax=Microdochium bolleyi TaxID=196109 RepID=A0A136J459_9PEZI|nr:hypothetical protein Micbo1qcDRAFT_233254 [Microdochium bolleyi]